jgi:phage gp46-like protein
MAQNLIFDPVKKDYVFTNGVPTPSDRVLEASYYAIAIPQGKYLYGDVGQGSYLYTLTGVKRTSSIEQQFFSYAKDALERQVIATGQATKVDVSNLEANKFGTSDQIDVTPSAVQITNEFNFISVG